MANQVRNHRSPCPTPQCQVVDADTATLGLLWLPISKITWPCVNIVSTCPKWSPRIGGIFSETHNWSIAKLQSVSFPRHRAVVCGRCNHGLFSSTYWRIPIDQVRTSKSWIRMLSFGASCTANPLRQEFQPHPSWPNTLLGYLWISWGFTDQPNWSRFLFCCRLNHHYPHLRAFSQPFPSENLTLFLSPGWGF